MSGPPASSLHHLCSRLAAPLACLPRCCALVVAATVAWPATARCESLPLPPLDTDLIGTMRTVRAEHADTLLDIARRFGIGQQEILLANRDVDRWLPGDGTEVVVPSRYILPDAQREGIVLNVPEMRLYYFPAAEHPGDATVRTYPVSIGRMDWATPLGVSRIVAKNRHPSWRPPESIRQEAAARGEPLPEIIPPGPDNPLGDYALRLSLPGYLIHSTNKPFGVGMRVTHGCVRMYPENIAELFPLVSVGTPVQIVNQPIKVGWLLDTLYIEVHPPLEEESETTALVEMAMDLVVSAWEKRPLLLNGRALKKAVEEQRGVPVAVARALSEPAGG
ncbi:MAG: L,D-transpeptidase family protein [Thiogranum sp.]|nr:L,D-transpeptidase family protein [Thiogranum sp.]